MPVVEIICLANSRKHSGRCVVGLRTDGNGWVRPVSLKREGTLFERDYTLTDGTQANVLDILRIPLRRPSPEQHHPENWVIGFRRWKLLARPAERRLLGILERFLVSGPALLGNLSDRVPLDSFSEAPAEASLALVRPTNLEWRITQKPDGRQQTRALFRLSGVHYDLAVTDPVWERRLRALQTGQYPLTSANVKSDDDILLTISLSEPFEGHCYKLVAAVIVLPRATGNQP